MSSKALATPAKRALPSKEASLFKELLNLYESRQLKKGLKTADLILKKFPEHGETVCMKGLVLTHMGKREEGIDLVKKGVRLDLTSHICWHVFGLIQKGEKNYEEALKSYTQALRFDKENLNILRDAAQLQTQLRIYDGLADTRYTLLRLRPNLRQHWIALAVAHHLNGNLVEAKKILEHYERTLKNVPDYDIEQSETLLYHVRLLEESGDYAEALTILDASAKSRAIVDRTAIMENRARLLSQLHSDEAEHAWRALVEHNPENYDYYRGYLANQGASLDETSSEAMSILKGFSTQLPKAAAPRRITLSLATGEEFKDLVKPYLISGFTKGIPSLFADIKSLYVNKEKQKVVEEIVEAAREEFSQDGSSSATSVEPTTYLWTLYFLAQHYSYLGNHSKSLTILDLAITHTPTLPELHTIKARVLKRAGDYVGGARALNEARLLDGQDRFLNTKCGKYLLRTGMIEEASSIFGLFTKKDATSPGVDLEDMQSLLYLLEEADAHNRHKKYNLALKKYIAVSKIFGEVEDDQYDFHGYNLRKFTFNVYLSLLKWEDQLRSHPAYVRAAISASKIYIAVHDDPTIATAASSSTQLTDAEKKAKKKAKKAASKVEDPKKITATIPSANEDKGLEATPKDDDPEGLKLISASDPLEQAAKLLVPLSNLAGNNIDVWFAIYDVAIRRRKLLQALKALNTARTLDSDHPELHLRVVDFQKTVSSLPQNPPEPIGPLVTETLPRLIPEDVTLETYNSQYLQQHSASAGAILASAKVSQKLESPREEVETLLFGVLKDNVQLSIPTALDIIEFLTSLKSPRTDEFRLACGSRFDMSTVFKTPAELATLRLNVLAPIVEVKILDEA